MVKEKAIYLQVAALEEENIRLKNEVQLLRETLGEEPEKKPKNCGKCAYFTQHYASFGSVFKEINSGHCTRGSRVKSNRKQEDSCSFFELRNYNHGR